MAEFTEKEKQELREKGVYLSRSTKKCDECGGIILYCEYWFGNVVKCENCGAATKGKTVKTREERKSARKEEIQMAKKVAKEKKEGAGKIGGVIVEGTAIASLYHFLADEKVHKIADTIKMLKNEGHKADPMNRMYQLGRSGKKADKPWAVTIDKDGGTIQMKLGKGAAAAAVKAKSNGKAAPAVEEKEEEEPETTVVEKKKKEKVKNEAPEVEPTISKAQSAVAKLVRRTLKSGKDWTKNKIMDHLKKEHGIEQARTEEAIKYELAQGGIVQEEMNLVLAEQ